MSPSRSRCFRSTTYIHLAFSLFFLIRTITPPPCTLCLPPTFLVRQGNVSAALVLGGVDVTGPHLYNIYPHGSSDKLPYLTMGSGSLAAMSVSGRSGLTPVCSRVSTNAILRLSISLSLSLHTHAFTHTHFRTDHDQDFLWPTGHTKYLKPAETRSVGHMGQPPASMCRLMCSHRPAQPSSSFPRQDLNLEWC